MSKRKTSLLIALPLLGMVYYVANRHLDTADQPLQKDARLFEEPQPASPSRSDGSPAQRDRINPAANASTQAEIAPDNTSVAAAPIDGSMGAAMPNRSSDTTAGNVSMAASIGGPSETAIHSASSGKPQPTNLTQSSDSVIGRPFPVSDSVMNRCEPEEDSPWTCSKLNELLPRLAKEPRDEAWATNMEGKLRELIRADGREFEIRALECRTTVCAIECASLQGLMDDASYEFKKEARLKTAERIWEYEKDPNGARVTVTLAVYTRN